MPELHHLLACKSNRIGHHLGAWSYTPRLTVAVFVVSDNSFHFFCFFHISHSAIHVNCAHRSSPDRKRRRRKTHATVLGGDRTCNVSIGKHSTIRAYAQMYAPTCFCACTQVRQSPVKINSGIVFLSILFVITTVMIAWCNEEYLRFLPSPPPRIFLLVLSFRRQVI